MKSCVLLASSDSGLDHDTTNYSKSYCILFISYFNAVLSSLTANIVLEKQDFVRQRWKKKKNNNEDNRFWLSEETMVTYLLTVTTDWIDIKKYNEKHGVLVVYDFRYHFLPLYITCTSYVFAPFSHRGQISRKYDGLNVG